MKLINRYSFDGSFLMSKMYENVNIYWDIYDYRVIVEDAFFSIKNIILNESY